MTAEREQLEVLLAASDGGPDIEVYEALARWRGQRGGSRFSARPDLGREYLQAVGRLGVDR